MEVRRVPRHAGEKEMLQAFLDQNRAVMFWKMEGAADEIARRAPFASDTSLIGLLQHLTVVEKSWFEEIFAGNEVEYDFDFDADEDAEWRMHGDETLAAALAAYEEQIARSNAIIAAHDLDDASAAARGGDTFSMRWIIVHLIEETARHAGHADILREHLDGSVGYLP